MSKDKVPALEVVGKPRSRGRGLPKSPEVDEGALERAESQIGHAPAPTAAPKATAPKKSSGRRRKKKQREEEILYIKGPKQVIEAFTKFKEDEDFKANWDALVDLMEQAGIEIADFDA